MEYRESRVRLDSALEVDQFGTLHATARIARIGIQTYRIDGQVIRELRAVDEVEKSVASFEAKPLTLNHPLSRVVTSDNAHEEMKGFATNLRYEDGWVVADIHVTHQDAVEAAQTTHNMFSNGYMADVVMLDEPAIWIDDLGVMGDKGRSYEYDAVQKGIEGNHIALVRNPRAGSGATFISDSDDDIITIRTDNDNDNLNIMEKEIKETQVNYAIHVDGKDLEISGNDAKEVSLIIGALNGKVDGLESELEVARATIQELEASAAKNDSQDISAEVQARTEIWSRVAPHLDSEVDYSLPVVEVKKLYLKSVAPNLSEKLDSLGETYVEGVWDIKQPEATAVVDQAKAVNDAVLEVATTTAPSESKAAKSDDLADLEAKYDDARNNYYNR